MRGGGVRIGDILFLIHASTTVRACRRAGWGPASMKIDAAVVGAGPSGAWAAYCLAQLGARVRIFDPSHPREKPCGGGISGRALKLVSDAIDTSRLPASVIRCARFHDSIHDVSVSVPLDVRGNDDAGPLVVASRIDFDVRLLDAAQQAGAELVPARVTDVVLESDGVRLETTRGPCRAMFLVGADGANSLVRRRVSRPFSRAELSLATGYFVHGVTSEEIVIELVANPPGYIWSFPRPSHLAIGVCAHADVNVTTTALRERIGAWMAATQITCGGRLEPYSWPIPTLGARSLDRLELSGDRWSVIGDAAGLVDPITREGIYFALLSGQWAAEALGGQLQRREYAARVRDEIVPELARAARLKSGFFRPSFIALLMHALRHSAAIRRVMADLIAGRQTYAGLQWRLAKTMEVRLAWRALIRELSVKKPLG